MKITVPISVGELMDKISILTIKKRKIQDPDKLIHVDKELSELGPLGIIYQDKIYKQLLNVNQDLWSIENLIRRCEADKDFSDKFIYLARKVYQLNDKRSELKNKINQKYSSEIVEVKSYNE